jgi:hypothetical protein
MWIDEIAEYLEGKNVAGVPDQVYVGTIPAGMTLAVMLAGPQVGVKVDPDMPGYHKTSLQMVVRAATSSTAEELAQLVSDSLETETMTTIEKVRINHIRPRHLPIPFPRSGGDYYEAVVNFDLCFVRLMA